MNRVRRHTGFATTAALMLVVVISAALLTLGGLLRADAGRTHGEAVDAQLRQLIHAAAIDARAKLDAGGDVPQSWDLAPPGDVGASVRVELNDRTATVTARVAEREVVERVNL
jgi:hypothetical protein